MAEAAPATAAAAPGSEPAPSTGGGTPPAAATPPSLGPLGSALLQQQQQQQEADEEAAARAPLPLPPPPHPSGVAGPARGGQQQQQRLKGANISRVHERKVAREGRRAKDQELRFDKAMSFELLKQSAMASMLDKGLARCVTASPLVVRAIMLQCCYVAKVLRGVKHRMVQGMSAGAADPNIALQSKPARVLRAFETSTWPSLAVALPTQVSIGIIGCGVVGTQVLEGLLSSRLFHVTCLSVSTRQPNHLPAYVQEGVQACYDNAEIASSADLLILAVLPTQFQDVARTVRGRVKKTAVVMSTLLGVSAERVGTVLEHPCCLTTSIDVTTLSSLADGAGCEGPVAGAALADPDQQAVVDAACLFPRKSLTKTENFVSVLTRALHPTPASHPMALTAVLCSVVPPSMVPVLVPLTLGVTGPAATHGRKGGAPQKVTTLTEFDPHLPAPIVDSICDSFAEVCLMKGT